jgi:hypothetical protein
MKTSITNGFHNRVMFVCTVPFPIDETFAKRRCFVSPNRSIASLQLFSSNASSFCHKKRMINDIKIILSKKLLYHLMRVFSYLATPLKIICHFTNLLT